MSHSLQPFAENARARIVQFLWRQWSALGVAGNARTGDSWLIDPEALLLFSTTFARYDARLFDEIIDWLEINGTSISLVRLSRMRKEEGLGEPSILAAIAEHLGKKSAHLNWQSLVKKAEPKTPSELLFPSLPVFGEPEPVFLQWGWEREPLKTRGMSQAPRPDQPSTFLFQLRGLFGRQARAEIIAWLLSHESGHPAKIARETSYYTRTVQQVLNELEETGHLRSFRNGREKVFAIRHQEWSRLIRWQNDGAPFPEWINWAPLFKAIEAFLQALDEPGLGEKSEAVQAIHLRETFEHLSPVLLRAGVATELQADSRLKGAALIEALLEDITDLLN